MSDKELEQLKNRMKRKSKKSNAENGGKVLVPQDYLPFSLNASDNALREEYEARDRIAKQIRSVEEFRSLIKFKIDQRNKHEKKMKEKENSNMGDKIKRLLYNEIDYS